LPDSESPAETFYAQGEWRFAPAWELLVRHDVFYRSRKDRNGRNFEALTGLPAHSMYAHDTTLGLRWDATPSIMVRAEYHRVNGTAWLPGPDLIAAAVAVITTVVLGLIGTFRALDQKPAPVLRRL
jgi:hypothetical protein